MHHKLYGEQDLEVDQIMQLEGEQNSYPRSLSALHLDVIASTERSLEEL